MIRITSNQLATNCEGIFRRELLRIGALGMGGLTLPRFMVAELVIEQGLWKKPFHQTPSGPLEECLL